MHASSLCLPGLGGTLHGGVHMGWGVPTTQQQPRCAPASWGAREPQHPTLHKGSSSSMVQPRLTGGGGCSPTGRRSPPPPIPPDPNARSQPLSFHLPPPPTWQYNPLSPRCTVCGAPQCAPNLASCWRLYLFIYFSYFIYLFFLHRDVCKPWLLFINRTIGFHS